MMSGRALFALLLLAVATSAGPGPGAADDRRPLVGPYLQALEARALGEVEGRAHGEPRRASSPPAPLEGVSVLLMPFSGDVDVRLDAIKRHQRDSLTAYVGAQAELDAIRREYERDLLAAGGGELIRGAVSDASGMLRLTGVPAGEWLLLGWREETHLVKGGKTPSKDATSFPDVPVLTGYGAVSYWRMRVSVKAGEVAPVSLSDRSVWLTAVREELTHPPAPPKKASDPKKRR